MNTKYIQTILCCISALFLACGSATNNHPDKTEGDVKILVTTNTRSYDLAWKTADFNKSPSMSPATITLNPTVRYQTIAGFGAAITGSSSYNLLRMTEADRMKFLRETFCPVEGMGHSYVRISIGCSDFSLSEYTLCDTPGIENFALQNEEYNYVIPILKEILKINPDLKIMGSPWTPPRWMKVNNLTDLQPHNSWTGGRLNPAFYQDYGTYFVKWIQAMEANGIPIESITPQNEPLHPGNSASLFMGWEEQRNFVRTALGPKLREAGLKTKIYIFDHNYNYDNIADQQDYVSRFYEDSEAAAFVAGAAFHNYGGHRDELLRVHARYPHKELVFTETSIGTWNDGRNLEIRLMEDMEEVGLGTVNNWCRAIIVWNLMLDNDRGPNRDGGCQTCFGAVDISNSDYRTITRNSHYYVLSHLSAVAKSGATRIGTTGYTATGLTYTAFENTDGTYSLVLLNNANEARRITVNDGANNFTYEAPAKSVVSYLWKK
ncbi:MAG: glucosylceramidase [Dysgonamonadaceae bacterium]|jgi:glucosylceramidase|nr:glucosylceramidase [Dysgonamonadaceae bacterium]